MLFKGELLKNVKYFNREYFFWRLLLSINSVDLSVKVPSSCIFLNNSPRYN